MNFRNSKMSEMELENQPLEVAVEPLEDPFLALGVDVIHEHIYQYLTGNDVKRMLMVSKQWKLNIGASPTAMKKIWLNYDTNSNCSRSLQSLDIEAILSSECRFYYVKLRNLNISDGKESQHFQLLEKISGSVRELHVGGSVKDLKVGGSVIDDVELSFPRLERLSLLGLLSWSTMKSILHSITADQLKQLYIANFCADPRFRAYLMRCNKLEDLTLYGDLQTFSFLKSEGVPFKLKKFSFYTSSYAEFMTPATLSTIKKFLRTQSSSLQRLEIFCCSLDVVNIALKSLPLLKELKVYKPSGSRKLFVNTSVEVLSLIYTDPRYVSSLLTALPNLTALKITLIDHHSYIDLIAMSMNLRRVTYSSSFFNVNQHYAMLMEMNPNINQNIEWHHES